MQLKNDRDGIIEVDRVVHEYYKKNGNRDIRHFLWSENKEWNVLYSHFLLERRHIFKLSVGSDRGSCRVGIELGIGPHYFGPADFWSYENYKRFETQASTDSIIFNLRLMDEFFGYTQNLR
jgi:hypothetical protein